MITAKLEKFEKLRDGSVTIILRGEPNINLHNIVDLMDKQVKVIEDTGEEIQDKKVLLAEILTSMRNIEEKLQDLTRK